MRKRVLFASALLTVVIACTTGSLLAFAATDSEGDRDAWDPQASPSALGEMKSEQDTQELSFGDATLSLSVDGREASLSGCAYALKDFSRAQKGSNRNVNDTYAGYCYYVSSSPDSVSVVATENAVVVYVSLRAAHALDMDIASRSVQESLRRLIIALDTANSKGGTLLSEEMSWYVTGEQEYLLEGVVFKFDQELKPNQYYTVVVGEDGSDVTLEENPLAVNLTHADSARLVPADEVEIVAPTTGLDAFGEFLARINLGPLWVTLKTTGVAIVFIFVLGLLAAYFSLRIPARAQDIADSIFTIPMVLPPTVCGFLLLLLLGKNTALGQWFIDIGFPLVFSWQATVIAAVVVAFPLMYRSARGAFENLDANMLDAARTLGWSNRKVFFKLMLPLSWSSIAAGTVLAFARALGEFGATMFLAGNTLGVTRTIPVAIYFEWMNGNSDVAIFWTIIIMIFSFIVILFINLWSRRTTRYRKGVSE